MAPPQSDGSVDAQALEIIAELKAGTKTIADLLGPLTGTKDMTPAINIKPGSKDPVPAAPQAEFLPKDDYNVKLVSNVGPTDYVNPEPLEKYDLVVIGSGAAGLLSVIIANGLGKTCALVEQHAMGGDCLNVGCVPSKGRLWQLGVGMAALDAHLRHTALSSEAAAAAAQESAGSVIVAGDGGGDPFWEAGGLLLAAVVEHACFAAGAVLFATSRVRTAAAAARARRNRNRQTGRRSTRSTGTINGGRQEENWDEYGGGGRTAADRRDDDEWRSSGDVGGTGGLGEGQQQRRQDRAGEEDGEDGEDGYESSSSYSLPPPRPDSSSTVPSTAPSSATAAAPPLCVGGGGGGGSSRAAKMYMAVVYPLFFRLLAAFVMIWDRQVAILNTIELLVATMQFVALSAVVGGPAAMSGMGEGGVAAMSVLAGLASKMAARAVLCLWFGSDPRTLRML